MKHPETNVIKDGFYGFSWTTFFWGGIPGLFRGDILIGLVLIVLNILTWFIAGIIWAFFYNKNYTQRLLEKGYVLDGSEAENLAARQALGIAN